MTACTTCATPLPVDHAFMVAAGAVCDPCFSAHEAHSGQDLGLKAHTGVLVRLAAVSWGRWPSMAALPLLGLWQARSMWRFHQDPDVQALPQARAHRIASCVATGLLALGLAGHVVRMVQAVL